MKNKIKRKFDSLTDKQKKNLKLGILIFITTIFLICTTTFFGIQIKGDGIIDEKGNIKWNAILNYMVTYSGIIFSYWKLILLLLESNKKRKMVTQAIMTSSNINQPKKTNFKSNGFEFVENKKDILIKPINQFANKEEFISSFKSATLEYCEYVRKSLER